MAFVAAAALLLLPLMAACPGRAESSYDATPLELPASGEPGFERLRAEETGVAFTNRLSENKAAENQIRLNGSGVALGDYDGDGKCDIYLCRLEGPNRLYRNLGHWEFEDVTEEAGVGCPEQYSTGTALADLDGDSDLDLLVNSIGGGTTLFWNEGDGRFRKAEADGLRNDWAAMSMTLADMDGDGDLDLYVTNYRTTTVRSTGLHYLVTGDGRKMLRPEDRRRFEVTSDGRLRENGEPDALYRNRGDGTFSQLSWTGEEWTGEDRFRDVDGNPLEQPPRDWGLAAAFRDLDGDGRPDLYVCNDFWSPDRIWINRGDGRFQAIRQQAIQQISTFSMGVDFADFDRDGLEDFFVLDMLSRHHSKRMTQASLIGARPEPVGRVDRRPQVERNTLFRKRSDGTYAEIAQLARVEATGWSWCPIFLDVDLDGFEDLLVSTGHGFDTQDKDTQRRLREKGPYPPEKVHLKLPAHPPLELPNYAFRNNGALGFTEVGELWGLDRVGITHGMAMGDLDNDGDLDLVTNDLNAEAGLYRNRTTAPRIAVRLRGGDRNTEGIGARIRARGGPVPQSQVMIKGGRYLSSDQAIRTFAADARSNRLTLTVQWPGGGRTELRDLEPNRLYTVSAPTGMGEDPPSGVSSDPAAPPETSGEGPDPYFEEVSARLGHRHVEIPYDDFARQPGLSRRLSQLGPGVAWAFWDDDRWVDLLIGSGKGGSVGLFKNRGGEQFERITQGPFNKPLERDGTTVLTRPMPGISETEGVMTGIADYEGTPDTRPALYEYDGSRDSWDQSLPLSSTTIGPLALTDVRGEGRLALFVGGRAVPGRYPEETDSLVLRREEGAWRKDRRRSAALEEVGLVSGAVWADLNGDARRELVLACDWGPIRVFEPTENGGLVERTTQWGLMPYQGWWNGVATIDADNDGQPDLIATNWGRNTAYERGRHFGIRAYYGQFDDDDPLEIVESYWDHEIEAFVPIRPMEDLATGFPAVAQRFDSHAAYAQASVRTLLGDQYDEAAIRTVNWVDTTLFLNRGDHFEMKPLPIEAQFAPAMAPVAGDFDGDGHDDVFLSQNFFATHPRLSRTDAGRGLWLRGNGDGSFEPVSGALSGIRVYGEQRGAAAADFDRDGRLDLVVSQNGADTKLFRNRRAKEGLRVRLVGGPSNPAALGAQIRMEYADGTSGPVREIQRGNGYWSQNGPVSVLGLAGEPAAVHVRWPDGTATREPVPSEIQGTLEVLKEVPRTDSPKPPARRGP